MNDEENAKIIEKKDAEAYRSAGIAYFPVAAMFVVYLVFLIIFMAQMGKVSTDGGDYGEYFIVYLIVFFLKRFYMFGAIVFAIVCALLAALFVWSGITLIKDSKNLDKLRGIKKALDVHVLALIILILSAIPFILGICRTIVRPAEEWQGFLMYGLMPFAVSLVCVVFGRIAAHRFKKSNFIL